MDVATSIAASHTCPAACSQVSLPPFTQHRTREQWLRSAMIPSGVRSATISSPSSSAPPSRATSRRCPASQQEGRRSWRTERETTRSPTRTSSSESFWHSGDPTKPTMRYVWTLWSTATSSGTGCRRRASTRTDLASSTLSPKRSTPGSL
ncbi:unnamed protein product, partial [Ectocarpus sp. 4 AP-2014]